jgi:uncharacterized protein
MNTSAVFLIIAGVGVGLASGALGIGGAILLIPVLVFIFGFSQVRAQGTSIGALVPPIGIFAAIHYYRAGLLDLRAAAFIAFGFVFGALAGAVVVPYIPQLWLRRGFASLLAYVAVQMALADPDRRVGAVLPGALAIAFLWLLYGARRLLGTKPAPPRSAGPPPTDYYI